MRKWITRIIAILYTAAILYMVFFSRRRRGNTDFSSQINRDPFKGKLMALKTYSRWPQREVFYFWQDIIVNLLLLLPLPIFIILIFPRRFNTLQLFFIVVLASLSIETLQYTFNVGVPDVDDVVLNTLGGCLGIIISKLFQPKEEKRS